MSEQEFDFFKIYNRFFDEAWPAKLTPTESLVWLAMAKHANGKTGEAWPGGQLLAKYLGHAAPDNVRRSRAALARMGLLIPVSVAGGRTSAHYKVCLPSPMSESDAPKSDMGKLNAPGASESSGDTVKLNAPGASESDARTTNRTTQRTNHTTGAAKPPPVGVALPLVLGSSPEFVSVWNDWMQHKSEMGQAITERMQTGQLAELQAAGVERAIESVQAAIAGNFKKPYTDSKRGKHNGKRKEFAEPNHKHLLIIRGESKADSGTPKDGG